MNCGLRSRALERREHTGTHLAHDGTDLGECEGYGGKGLGVLLQVLDHGGGGMLEAVGLV
jgi:hypothetical protein